MAEVLLRLAILHKIGSGSAHEWSLTKVADVSVREVEIFLDAVVAMAEPVKTHFLWRPQSRLPLLTML